MKVALCFSLCRSFVIDLKVKLVLTNVYLKKSCDHKIYEIAYIISVRYVMLSIAFCTLLVISVLNYMYF